MSTAENTETDWQKLSHEAKLAVAEAHEAIAHSIRVEVGLNGGPVTVALSAEDVKALAEARGSTTLVINGGHSCGCGDKEQMRALAEALKGVKPPMRKLTVKEFGDA